MHSIRHKGTIRINIPPIALALNPFSAPGKFHFILGIMFSAFVIIVLKYNSLCHFMPNIQMIDNKKPAPKKPKIPQLINFLEVIKAAIE